MTNLNKLLLTAGIVGSLGIFGNEGYGQANYFDIFPKEVSGDTIYLPNKYKFEKTKVNDSVSYFSAIDRINESWKVDSISSVDHLKNIIALYEGTMDSYEVSLGGHPIFGVKYVQIIRKGKYEGINSMENLNKICERLTKYNKEQGIDGKFITKEE